MTLPPALRRPAFWLWLALAAWPPELLASLMHWEIVDPAYVGVLLAWWPVDVAGRLGALALLMADGDGRDDGGMGRGVPMGRPSTANVRSAAGTALAAEVLLGLKTTLLGLAGAVPGLAWLSYRGMDSPAAWGPPALLVLLGLMPCIHYLVLRLGAPILILRGESNATRALDASAAQMRGKLRIFLVGALPWLALSWGLDGLSQALPEAPGLLLAPLSYAAALLGLWRGWQRLDPAALAFPGPRA